LHVREKGTLEKGKKRNSLKAFLEERVGSLFSSHDTAGKKKNNLPQTVRGDQKRGGAPQFKLGKGEGNLYYWRGKAKRKEDLKCRPCYDEKGRGDHTTDGRGAV